MATEKAAPLYVARAFCVGGERLEVGAEFAHDPKTDRVLVAELKAAGKLTADKPAAVLEAEAAEAEAAANAAAEAAEAAKPAKKA